MALTQIRALVAGQWYELTYNPDTLVYEAEITAPNSSYHEPGGAYNIAIEASNETGNVSTVDASDFPALSLTVVETTPPVLTLVSPSQGHLTTDAPTIAVDVTDAGSLIDPDTVAATLDGEPVSVTLTEITNGYRASYTPQHLDEGARRIVFTASDYDGSAASLALDYIIDTVPPVLRLESPHGHTIVDTQTLPISGWTDDDHALPVTVTMANNGAAVYETVVGADGRFSFAVPLTVGGNQITITAADAVGWTSVVELLAIRLVTDRTEADVSYAERLLTAIAKGRATQEQIDEHNRADQRGTYNYTDINRVTAAMEYLTAKLDEHGYFAAYVPVEVAGGRTVWGREDIPYPAQMARYLANAAAMDHVLSDSGIALPPDMERLTTDGANAIERLLVATDALFVYLDKSYVCCGEVYCGEF